MTTEERDQAVGQAYREKQTAADECKDAQVALVGIGVTLEHLAAKLQGTLPFELTESERLALDATRIDGILSDWKAAASRFRKFNDVLEGR
jgi:hypothetical protein